MLCVSFREIGDKRNIPVLFLIIWISVMSISNWTLIRVFLIFYPAANEHMDKRSEHYWKISQLKSEIFISTHTNNEIKVSFFIRLKNLQGLWNLGNKICRFELRLFYLFTSLNGTPCPISFCCFSKHSKLKLSSFLTSALFIGAVIILLYHVYIMARGSALFDDWI